jgi:hypothetical protein
MVGKGLLDLTWKISCRPANSILEPPSLLQEYQRCSIFIRNGGRYVRISRRGENGRRGEERTEPQTS